MPKLTKRATCYGRTGWPTLIIDNGMLLEKIVFWFQITKKAQSNFWRNLCCVKHQIKDNVSSLAQNLLRFILWAGFSSVTIYFMGIIKHDKPNDNFFFIPSPFLTLKGKPNIKLAYIQEEKNTLSYFWNKNPKKRGGGWVL